MRAQPLRTFAATLALCCIAPCALAQNQDRVDVYHFEDDDLLADTWGTAAPLLKVRSEKLPRVLLLRPRASFVAELTKTLETL